MLQNYFQLISQLLNQK